MLTIKKLNELRASIVEGIDGLDGQIQVYLMAELQHIEAHRNPTRLNEFFTMVKGKGSRVTAMNGFCQYYGNIVWDENDKLYKMQPKREQDTNEWIEAMNSTLWIDFKPEVKTQDYFIDKKINSVIKAATKAIELGIYQGDQKKLEKLIKFAETL